MKTIMTALIAALVLTGTASAQDAAGTWDVNLTTPQGAMTVALTVKKDGEKLSGSIAGPQGELPIQGTQKEKAVNFNFTVQTPNGPFPISMSGSQDGDSIAGTIDFNGQGQSEWNGKRRGGAAAAATGMPTQDKGDKVDVSGAWAMQIDLGGNTGTPTVTLKQDGEKLSGTYSSQVLGEQQLTGTIKGSAIEFGFTASFEGNAVKVTYTGTVEKDTMKGTVAFGDMASGTFTGKKK